MPAVAVTDVRHDLADRGSRGIALWLAGICLLIISMVVVGGVTRLTGSGLSIVEWQPVMGAIPPLNEGEWLEAFKKYQAYPQYQLMNRAMTLDGFKLIFFWEYIHRLLGRLIGVAFFLPWLYFLVTKKLERSLAYRLCVGFALGALQGALGWFMVASGLVDRPYVSHYRLAAHLILALVTVAYLFTILLDLVRPKLAALRNDVPQLLRPTLLVFTVVLSLQIVWGAFVAGLKAGHGYNTFPLMMGQWISPDAFRLEPGWLNLFETPAMVQFVHRTLGWLLLLLSGALWAFSYRLASGSEARLSLRTLAAVIALQFMLGIWTLILSVPLALAALHQLVGCVAVLVCLWSRHELRASVPARSPLRS